MAPSDLLMLAAANATDGNNPNIVTGVSAASSSVAEAGTNAQAATQLTKVQDVADQLKTQNAQTQNHLWSTFTGPEQAQLKSIGYQPPHGGSSLWGDIVNVAESPIRDIVSPALHSSPVHDITQALGAPLRFTQHLERAATEVIGNQAHAIVSGLPDTGLGRAFSIEDWTKAWNQTSSGQSYIDPVIRRQALNKFGQQTYTLAYEMATTTGGLQGVLAKYQNNPTLQQQIYQQAQSPEVKNAYALLNAGHISFGRVLVGPSFMVKHPELGSALSGGIDAFFDWFTDPLASLGKMVKGTEDARFLVHRPEDVQTLYDNLPSVKAAMADIANHIASGNTGELLDRYPQAKAAINRLIGEKADTEEKVLGYFKTEAASIDLIKGSPANSAAGLGGVLPHLNAAGRARLLAKGKLTDSIDWAADRVANNLGIKPEDKIEQPLIPSGMTDRIITGMGRVARKATTLVPTDRIFNPNDPDSINVLRDIGLMNLPRATVNHIIGEYGAAADIGAKWRIYRSLMIQMGKAAGLDRNQQMWEDWYGRFAATEGRQYSAKGNDIWNVDDDMIHAAVLKNHMSNGWAIPNFRQLFLDSRKTGLTHMLTGAINMDWMDKFMGMWRPLVLARLGFAPRVGGEEAAAFVAREGLGSYLKAIAAEVTAKKVIRDAGKLADKNTDDLVDNQAAGVWNMLTSHLPTGVVNGIHTAADLTREYTLDQVSRSFHGVANKMTSGIYRQAIQALLDHGELRPEDLTAMHGYDQGQIAGDVSGFYGTQRVYHKGKMVNAEIVPDTGTYKSYSSRDKLYTKIWYRALHEIATDDWGREALSRAPWEDPETGEKVWNYAGRLKRVTDRIMADPMYKNHLGSTQDRAGHLVASGEITQEEAARDLASAVIRHVDRLTTNPRTGKLIGGIEGTEPTDAENAAQEVLDKAKADLAKRPNSKAAAARVKTAQNKLTKAQAERPPANIAEHMLRNGKPPTLAFLDDMRGEDLPYEVQGPETKLVFPKEDLIRKSTSYLFKKYIGPQINWISRDPMYIHQYALARQAYAPMARKWLDDGMSERDVENLVHQNSRDRAIAQTIPFVHNPELRSQMATLTRNVSPFWFAQEQFYKRWGRTVKYAPATIRKAQLLSSGFRHSGLVQTDPSTGQQYFIYPGSAVTQEVLTHALWWLHAGVPVGGALAGQTNMLNPAMQRLNGPNFGPLAIFPMNAVKTIDPHFTGVVDGIEGKSAAATGLWQSFVPTTILRAAEIAAPQLNASQYASAQMQAIQALEATGHGVSFPAVNQVQSTSIPHPKAGDYVLNGNGIDSSATVYQPDGQWVKNTPQTMEAYRKRVANWARVIMITRLLYGFAAPASPETYFNPGNLHNDIQNLMKEMPIDQAITTFLAAHPDATPYTVFATQDSSGGFLPATNAAMHFLDSNSALVKGHPLAATYFLPQNDTKGAYSLAAYQEQLADGMRQRKTPDQMYQQIMYQQAANIYFKVEDQKNAMLAARQMPARQITDQWVQWSENFLNANPVFAALLGSGTVSSTTVGSLAAGNTGRMQLMEDIGGALNDHTAPDNSQTAALKVLYNTWAAWQSMTGSFGNPNQPTVSSSLRMSIDEQYAEWLAKFVQENPGVQPLVNRAIRPDLSQAIDQLAAQGTAITL